MGIFIFLKTFRPLGPTCTPIQRVQLALLQGVKQLGRGAN